MQVFDPLVFQLGSHLLLSSELVRPFNILPPVSTTGSRLAGTIETDDYFPRFTFQVSQQPPPYALHPGVEIRAWVVLKRTDHSLLYVRPCILHDNDTARWGYASAVCLSHRLGPWKLQIWTICSPGVFWGRPRRGFYEIEFEVTKLVKIEVCLGT